jgi:hypothetical protein
MPIATYACLLETIGLIGKTIIAILSFSVRLEMPDFGQLVFVSTVAVAGDHLK